MDRKITLLQNLVAALDDTRSFHCNVREKVATPQFRRVLERTIHSHLAIATELSGCIAESGRIATRGGTVFGPLRAQYAGWLARTGFDIELGYAIQAAKFETRTLQYFRAAVERCEDALLRAQLDDHRRWIEYAQHAFYRVEFMLQSESVNPLRMFTAGDRTAAYIPIPRTYEEAPSPHGRPPRSE